MRSLKPIQLAIQLAEGRRDTAMQHVAQAQHALAHAHAQLEQLTSYAQDTSQAWHQAAQRSVSAVLLNHHHQFMDRLRQAIDMQQGVCTNLRQEVEKCRTRLAGAQARLMGLKKVLERRRGEMTRKQDRREQQQMDEFAALRSRFGVTSPTTRI